jgi:Pathogenicity locus
VGNRTLTKRRGLSETERETVARLRKIPNVGPKMVADLLKLGVRCLEDAAGRDPDEMYHELCALDTRRHDPCVRDVFAAVVFFAESGPARSWWEFTPQRKKREAKECEVREKAEMTREETL